MHVHHTNIQVKSAQASIVFYRRLGFELVGCMRLDPVVLYYMGMPGGQVVLELTSNPSLADRSPGTGHIGIAVGDLDALLGELERHSITPEMPPFHPGDRANLRVCFVRDPDGVRIELIENDFPIPQDALPS